MHLTEPMVPASAARPQDLPTLRLPTRPVDHIRAVAHMLRRKGSGRALDELATALRSLPRAVIGRIADDRLLLDLRCLEDAEPFTTQWPALQVALS